MVFNVNFTNKGENILKILAKDEGMINYNNFSFKTGLPNIGNFEFLKRFGIFYDLLIDLLSKNLTIDEAKEEQIEMNVEIIEKRYLKELTPTNIKLLLESKDRKYTKELTLSQKNVLINAEKQYDKRQTIINAFEKKNILPVNLEPEIKLESLQETTAERVKRRKQIKNEIAEKEKNIENKLFKEYFKYQNPSDIQNWKVQKILRKIKFKWI